MEDFIMAELMAKEAFRKRVNNIIKLKNENTEDFKLLGARLKEKGTEYTIIIPLLEVILEYDPLHDFRFEYFSDDNNNQRFDVSIQSKSDRNLLIEAKSIEKKELTKTEKEQMINYLEKNEKCPWGILTNGIEWWFFICRDYIEKVVNKGDTLTQKKEHVFPIMKLNIDDRYFLDFMYNFTYEKLDYTWEKIANFCLKIIEGGGGKYPKIHDGEKDIDEYIKEKIKDKLHFQKGDYYEFIQDGQLTPNQQVICENDFLKAEFRLNEEGKLVIENLNILDFKEFSKNCNTEHISEWINENYTFSSPKEFRIKIDQDYEKKHTKKLKEKYDFKPDSEDL